MISQKYLKLLITPSFLTYLLLNAPDFFPLSLDCSSYLFCRLHPGPLSLSLYPLSLGTFIYSHCSSYLAHTTNNKFYLFHLSRLQNSTSQCLLNKSPCMAQRHLKCNIIMTKIIIYSPSTSRVPYINEWHSLCKLETCVSPSTPFTYSFMFHPLPGPVCLPPKSLKFTHFSPPPFPFKSSFLNPATKIAS